jgi:hypothetical protein
MTNKKSRMINVVEDPDNPGELLLDLGNELCAELGWQAGDTVEWIDQKDGSWLLTSTSQMNRKSAQQKQ